VSGSTVCEVTAFKVARVLSEERAGGGGLRGEALVLDLPGRRVFVLLTISGEGFDLEPAVTRALSGGKRPANVDEYVAAVRSLGSWFGSAKADLPRVDWPLMVAFRDARDARSMERVNPAEIGVRRISLETTNDAITTGIDEKLPWLQAAEKFRYNGTPAGELYPLPAWDFRSGTK
jgi:hypothetical protein